jgi:hypothetical protein
MDSMSGDVLNSAAPACVNLWGKKQVVVTNMKTTRDKPHGGKKSKYVNDQYDKEAHSLCSDRKKYVFFLCVQLAYLAIMRLRVSQSDY